MVGGRLPFCRFACGCKLESRFTCVDTLASSVGGGVEVSSACSAMKWCLSIEAKDTDPLAVMGILSTSNRTRMRSIIRRTWLSRLPERLSAWFIVRGIGADTALLDESAWFSDMLFVGAASNLSRAVGPLHSIFLWFSCAAMKFPLASFVGKLDDDTWLYPDGVVALLSSLLPLSAGGVNGLYVGSHEGYFWDEADGRPVGCRVRTFKILLRSSPGRSSSVGCSMQEHCNSSTTVDVLRVWQVPHDRRVCTENEFKR